MSQQGCIRGGGGEQKGEGKRLKHMRQGEWECAARVLPDLKAFHTILAGLRLDTTVHAVEVVVSVEPIWTGNAQRVVGVEDQIVHAGHGRGAAASTCEPGWAGRDPKLRSCQGACKSVRVRA